MLSILVVVCSLFCTIQAGVITSDVSSINKNLVMVLVSNVEIGPYTVTGIGSWVLPKIVLSVASAVLEIAEDGSRTLRGNNIKIRTHDGYGIEVHLIRRPCESNCNDDGIALLFTAYDYGFERAILPDNASKLSVCLYTIEIDDSVMVMEKYDVSSGTTLSGDDPSEILEKFQRGSPVICTHNGKVEIVAVVTPLVEGSELRVISVSRSMIASITEHDNNPHLNVEEFKTKFMTSEDVNQEKSLMELKSLQFDKYLSEEHSVGIQNLVRISVSEEWNKQLLLWASNGFLISENRVITAENDIFFSENEEKLQVVAVKVMWAIGESFAKKIYKSTNKNLQIVIVETVNSFPYEIICLTPLNLASYDEYLLYTVDSIRKDNGRTKHVATPYHFKLPKKETRLTNDIGENEFINHGQPQPISVILSFDDDIKFEWTVVGSPIVRIIDNKVYLDAVIIDIPKSPVNSLEIERLYALIKDGEIDYSKFKSYDIPQLVLRASEDRQEKNY